MTIWEGLHRVILGPIELLFDVIFSLCMQVADNPVIAIAVLSLAINLLILPLYQKADALQKEEQETAARLKPRLDRIKKAFSGDERFMMIQTYYRQNHYKPWYVLRSSVSLLLQIPFFMAAYNFLSNLQTLQGVGFGPIRDLGQPDGMLTIAGITINVLPILMTAINLVSGAIYTRGMGAKSKIQLYGMAAVFLVLLYNSPAGLVLYWTLNNVFSLAKNAVNRARNPGRVVRILCSAAGIALGVFALRERGALGERRATWALIGAAVMQIPILAEIIGAVWRKIRGKSGTTAETTGTASARQNGDETAELSPAGVGTTAETTGIKTVAGSAGTAAAAAETAGQAGKPAPDRKGRVIFFASCILLTILTGVLIPSAVISSSPAEFVEVGYYQNPLHYVWNSFLIAAGLFSGWFSVYYLLADEKTKRRYSAAVAALATIAVINFMFFGNGYGDMNSHMQYGLELPVTGRDKMVNAAAIVAAAGAIWVVYAKKREIIAALCVIECAAITGMSAVNIVSIARRLPEIEKTATQAGASEDIIHLDRKGKNVVVLMMDRSIGGLIPFVFGERPELVEQFRGFVFYPNTISYGTSTNTGSPALYGGYDYVPEKIDVRADVPLAEKQNEALKTMPWNFLQAGWEVTVCDPPYANYQWIPDLSIYDEMPEVRRFNTEGTVRGEDEAPREHFEEVRNRNMFCYSLFRISPVAVHTELYDLGNYNSSNAEQRADSRSTGTGYDEEFLNAYEALKGLGKITTVSEEGKNCFLMLANQTTHHMTLLQEPEYEPRERVDNREYDAAHPIRYAIDGRELILGDLNWTEHYQMNMAAYIQIGKWLDRLRAEGVYDNTRIIIVADHGWSIGYPGNDETAKAFRFDAINPVLMIKDFGSDGDFRTDGTFMTNADTPTIAFAGIIAEPRNPYLDKPISDEDRGKASHRICSADWHVKEGETVFHGSYWDFVFTEE